MDLLTLLAEIRAEAASNPNNLTDFDSVWRNGNDTGIKTQAAGIVNRWLHGKGVSLGRKTINVI